MVPNRVFFPQVALDEWVHADRVLLTERELVIKAEGRRYRLLEAARVLAEVTGGEDLYDLVGRVKTVAYLTELGAELLESSMIIDDLAYDVVPGFLGSPIGTFEQHITGTTRRDALADSRDLAVQNKPQSDEELLAQYLARTLE